MDNVPVRSPAPAGRHAAHSLSNSEHKGGLKKNKSKLALLIAGVAVVLLLACGGWFLYQSSARAHIDESKYQAVFFTNGQVYFGKLRQLGGGYFRLTDVFYIQAATADSSKNPQETSEKQSSDMQLIKLGNEVHGPDDEMIISQDQVLFFENLKKDGKVAGSITQYNSTEKK
jgi:hypothetical protein